MKPVRLPASATNALPRWGLFALCLLYILPGLIGRDPWKNEDAAGFGIMWTMAHGTWQDWLTPNIVGLAMSQEGPLAYWIGALFIQLFGWLLGDVLAARIASVAFFLVGATSVWYAAYLLGRRNDSQPLRLAFGGQPEPRDYGRTLADGALLIFLGCLGLLVHSHSTSANALHISLVAFSLYAAARFFENNSARAAIVLGIALGLMALTRTWLMPLALWLALVIYDTLQNKSLNPRLLALTLPIAVLVPSAWIIALHSTQAAGNMQFAAWMATSFRQLNPPSLDALKYLVVNGIWFVWPAWPFAAWAVYAWRRQYNALHIALPFIFCNTIALLAILNVHSEPGILLPLLPSLAILAAFGLPTMKRGTINAVDWFSVMTLTTVAGFIWLGWIAKQTGWPAQLARNAFKLAPGFKPEFNLFALIVAIAASAGWIALVHWRISRRPPVLWRAVVLSSGGVILCWLLIMTLWLPWGNYMRSYGAVARQLALELPHTGYCVEAYVGPAQRASFAYLGGVTFARNDSAQCDYLLLQDNNRRKDDVRIITRSAQQWRLLWEGRRPADRDERFRLYQRIH
ncbi:MAG: glycosyltransferase [Burkholderiales bacterium]|nr:glycosyltransferase [Burkholderiales bacterium]